MAFETNLDPYMLVFTFLLGAASAFFYSKSNDAASAGTNTTASDSQAKRASASASLASANSPLQVQQAQSPRGASAPHAAGRAAEEEKAQGQQQGKGKGKTVRIYVDGCWDLCHSGHYNAIRQAKGLGDHLVVGVHSSQEISRNKRWPIMSDKERVACVDSCKWVDQVVFDVPYSPSLALLDREDVSADYCAHGDDIAIAANGKSAYAEVEDRLKIFKRTPGVSTTVLITRIICALRYQEAAEAAAAEPSASPPAAGPKEARAEDESKQDGDKAKARAKARKARKGKGEGEGKVGSWSQFLSSSHRIAAFSNNRTPRKDDKVVYLDGVFDLFHAGHIAAIKEAKREGTFLYVGLFDDSIVRKHKGPYFPLMNIQERTLNVLSCKFVDEVIIGCPWDVSQDMINVLNIETVVSCSITNELGDEHDDRFRLAKEKGMFRVVKPKDCQLTTTGLMKRIARDQQRMEKENANRVQKEKAYMQSRQYVAEG